MPVHNIPARTFYFCIFIHFLSGIRRPSVKRYFLWPVAGFTLDLEIGFVKMRSSNCLFLLKIYIQIKKYLVCLCKRNF